MKEQYQKEAAKIHVPAELLQKTKQAMREEEEKQRKSGKRGKIILFRSLTAAAAAIILLAVGYPALSSFFQVKSGEDNRNVQIQLAEQKPAGMDKIEKPAGAGLVTEETEKMPEEFKTGEEIQIGNQTFRLIRESDSSYLKAYYEKEQTGYVVSSQITDEKVFLEELSQLSD